MQRSANSYYSPVVWILLVALASPTASGAQQPVRLDQVKQWDLTLSVEQSGETISTATAMSPSGPVTVTGKSSYNVTCTATAVLKSEGFGGFAGPLTSDCAYTTAGSGDTPFLRATMTGTGVPDSLRQDAGLSIDTQRGTYTFGIYIPRGVMTETTSGTHCQPPPVVTPTSQCVWTPFSEVTTTILPVARIDFTDLPIPPGATELIGTNSDPPDDDPAAKRTVSWSFTPVGAKDTVVVVIEGPDCACLDGEKVPGTQVTWIAVASKSGGTFSPIALQSSGSAPKVVANTGGAGASLTLEPDQTTGALQLTATYRYKGRMFRATRDVAFCLLDSIRIGDGSRDIAFDDASPGELRVLAGARALYNGTDATSELAWTFERIGAAATTTMTPANPTGGSADVTYTGLPEFNAAFGPKEIEVRLNKGTCDCARTDRFRAFYSAFAANHPATATGSGPGDAPVPNWFYYYSQTPAIAGVPSVYYARSRFSARDNRQAIAQFDESDGNIYLTELIWQQGCRAPVAPGGAPVAPGGAGNTGIDCVAENVRHEAQHRADWSAWWPNGYLIPADVDVDGVPMSVELTRPGCDPTSAASCNERPFTDVGDREIFAYWVGWKWPTGSINAQDWLCGDNGKQWRGGYGCVE